MSADRSLPCVLGLDVGTSSVKGILVDETGRVVAAARHAIEPSHPRPGWSEQDPEDWWDACRSVMRELASTAPENVAQCRAVGVSGQMHGAVLLDDAGRSVRPAILWNDARSAPQCERVTADVGFDTLLATTGNRAYPGFTAPKIAWLREHEPHALDRVRHLMCPKDFVNARLTGDPAIDASDASGTLLLDRATRDWSTALADAWGVERGWLPPVRESRDVVGTVRASDDIAIPHGIPVVAGAGDQAAAAVGSGIVRPGRSSICVGTSGVVFSHTRGREQDPEGIAHAFAHAVDGAWHLLGVMLSAGGALDWFLREVAREPSFDAIAASAMRAPPGANGVVFLPYLAGERCPIPDPTATGGFHGLHLGTRNADLARAVIEGIVAGLAGIVRHVETLGANLDRLSITGGMAQNDWIAGLLAGAIGRPLERAAADEGSAFGAALLAATTLDGGTVTTWADRWTAPGRPITPDPEGGAAIAQLIDRQTALHGRLAGRRPTSRQP